MSLGRILGVVLSFIFALSFINSNINNNEKNNSFELIGDSGSVTEEKVKFDNVSLNEDNNSNVEVIKYTNNQPYSIALTASDILVGCNGSVQSDVDLVNNNMKVSALFSKLDSNNKSSSINIKPKETVYIYIVNEYSGTYPSSNVTCNYSINIQDF